MMPRIVGDFRPESKDLSGAGMLRPTGRWALIAKRAVDILVSLILIGLSWPMLTLIAAAVWIDDGSPIFFRQARAGRLGVTFRIWKFRTMHVGAPETRSSDGCVVAQSNDVRFTRMGASLRARGIDEAPQLLNVLAGDMSLVGPRPDLVDQLPLYGLRDHERLMMRPGLTGLTVIRGRDALNWRQKKRWDRHYVRNWSLGLDLRILCATARLVFRPGAPAQ
ncbi:MAG: sugar transferase [Longimicrobiales bacterium]